MQSELQKHLADIEACSEAREWAGAHKEMCRIIRAMLVCPFKETK